MGEIPFSPFRLDTFTHPSAVLKFAVSLSRFRTLSISSLFWSSDVTLLGFVALIQICRCRARVFSKGFKHGKVCAFSVTSEIILVFPVCNYFQRN